jgi:hypothetical protein
MKRFTDYVRYKYGVNNPKPTGCCPTQAGASESAEPGY